MRPSPLGLYRQRVDAGSVTRDPEQLKAVMAFESLWQELGQQPRTRIFHRLRQRNAAAVRGLYLWGGVGRGKTWLMDLFFETLPGEDKLRVHFHRFMQRVHHELRDLGRVRDPLPKITANWAAKCRVLCLDEFFVADIADAMLLAGLLENLFAHGVTLVTTTNTQPDQLYRDGLQRARFLPAIDLIKTHMQVHELKGGTDFRLRILEQSEIFHYPLDADADRAMKTAFESMSAQCELRHDLEINGRQFHARRRGDGIIWFDFEELCEKPRGSSDFIEIARAFNTVIISNTPQLGDDAASAVRRFITMVDEFYDRNVKLLMSAEVPAGDLYTGTRLSFEFERTSSRLTEMQSHDYLAHPHLP